MTLYKKWTITTLSLFALLLLVIAIANYVIDPYGIYHNNSYSFNYNKSVDSDPYLFKAYQGKKYKPEAITLGTSRAMRLDPPVIKALTGESAYSLGLATANPYINLKYLEYMIKVDPNLHTVYYGLDFEVFAKGYPNHPNFKLKRLESPLYMKDWFVTLLSKKALQDSSKVVTDNVNHTSKYTEHRFIGDGSYDESLVTSPAFDVQTFVNLPTAQYQLSRVSIQYVKEIKQLCDQHNIDLHMYISPVHSIILETFWQNNLWGEFEQWKRELVKIAPIWDFSGYHDIAMKSIKDREYYNNLAHFSKKVGNLILYRMLDQHTDQVPSYFGVYLTPQNIEAHLTEIKDSRDDWPMKDMDMATILNDY
jgi:hypothetical protein